MKIKKTFSSNNIIIAVYFFLTLFSSIRHEIWRDEGQAWLIARDIPDISSFFKILGYEGSPGLYHIILAIMAKAGLPVLSMLVLNVLIMTAAIAFFIYKFPFKTSVKALLVFGYYMVYEYGTIARSYSLLIFCLFAMAYIYPKIHEHRILYPLLILLLANTSLHGTIIAMAFAGGLFIDMVFIKKQQIKALLLPMFISAVGIAAAVLQILPPDDLGAVNKWNLNVLPQLVASFGLLPLVSNSIHFWNSTAIPMVLLKSVLGFVALAVPALTIRKLNNMLICYTAWTGLLIISCLRYIGGYRHAGLLFIVYIVVLWIDYEEERDRLFSSMQFKTYAANFILPCMLTIGMLSSAISLYYDMNYDFSSSKKAAAFLKDSGYTNNELVIVYPANYGTAISSYLGDHHKFYSIEYGKDISYIVWNKSYEEYNKNYYYKDSSFPYIDSRILDSMKSRSVDEAVLVTNMKIDDKTLKGSYLSLASFDETISNDESFYIYKVKIKQ